MQFIYYFLYRTLLVGDPDTCGSDMTSRPCSPEIPLPLECIVCIDIDTTYQVGDLISTQNGGCVKWYSSLLWAKD